MKKPEEIVVYEGSGNPFQDAGHPNPEEALAKAELAIEICSIIKASKLCENEVTEILGIDLNQFSEIICGKLSRYSIARLA